jgi:hypothetical protein
MDKNSSIRRQSSHQFNHGTRSVSLGIIIWSTACGLYYLGFNGCTRTIQVNFSYEASFTGVTHLKGFVSKLLWECNLLLVQFIV